MKKASNDIQILNHSKSTKTLFPNRYDDHYNTWSQKSVTIVIGALNSLSEGFFRGLKTKNVMGLFRKRYSVISLLNKALWRYEDPPAAPPP